jgi:hypothetical protein
LAWFPTKQVRTLHKKLKFTGRVEKNLTEKQIKRAKHLQLATTTLKLHCCEEKINSRTNWQVQQVL